MAYQKEWGKAWKTYNGQNKDEIKINRLKN